jgi:hypothetical protein
MGYDGFIMSLFLFVAFGFWNPAHALPFSFEGYGALRILYLSAGETQWQLVERVRPTLELTPHKRISFVATADLSLWQGREEGKERVYLLTEPVEAAVPPSFDGSHLTFDEIDAQCGWGIVEPNSFVDAQYFFDRLYVDIALDALDIRIGRQALTWGTALFLNPTDVVPQTLLQTPWQERAGVDAIRATIPISRNSTQYGEAEVVATLEQIGGQFSLFFDGWEGSLVAVGEETQQRIGVNLRGEYGIGWWGEFAYQIQDTDSFLKANVGVDYTIPLLDGMWFFAQVFHDDSGQIPALYEWNRRDFGLSLTDCPELNLDFVDQGTPYRETLGRWYTLSGQKTSIWEEWEFQSLFFVNLSDQTGIHSQFISWKGSDVEAMVGMQQRFGVQGEFAPPPVQTTFMGADLSSVIPSWRILSWLRVHY